MLPPSQASEIRQAVERTLNTHYGSEGLSCSAFYFSGHGSKDGLRGVDGLEVKFSTVVGK